jgi:hypothetical protein
LGRRGRGGGGGDGIEEEDEDWSDLSNCNWEEAGGGFNLSEEEEPEVTKVTKGAEEEKAE